MIDHPELSQVLINIILSIWQTENITNDWNVGRLMILPKKGDLGLPKNHRWIILLETACKIIPIILHSPLLPIKENLDHEPQCGFIPDLGCIDAFFSVKTALQKQWEHGKESWVPFLGLVKAFDDVPRQLLWLILQKFWVPTKLTSHLKPLHESFTIKLTVDEVTHMSCTICVKQEILSALYCLRFLLADVMITCRATTSLPFCLFKIKTGCQNDWSQLPCIWRRVWNSGLWICRQNSPCFRLERIR